MVDKNMKMPKNISQLFDFITLTHEFREITRVARNPINFKFENDTEHSYQLAMVSWFIIEQNKLKLNKELCFKYALAHDLVEVYAGDTYAYDKESVLSKEKREKDAIKKLEKRFSNFEDIIKIIKNYEKKKDDESNFVYALDKMLPPVQIYLEKGKLWREKNISYNDLINLKNKKIAESKYVDKYWQEILKLILKDKNKLFKNEK